MTPFFAPPPNPYGAPKVFLAAVGEKMTEVAGEVADGIIIHGFTTERYVKEVTMPAVERGLKTAGRDRSSFQVSGPLFVVTGTTDEEIAAAKTGVKQQIAFYGSTPAYRGVLELHGWGDLQTELNGLSKQGKWVEMGELIDDEVLNAFAVVAGPDGVGAELKRRYGGVVDRCSFYAPYKADPRAVDRGDRRPEAGLGGRARVAKRRIDATHASGSCCGPKWPSPGEHLERGRAGSAPRSLARAAGRSSVDVSPHTTRTSESISPSRAYAPWFGPIAYTRASTSGRHFSSSTPSPRSRSP